MTFAQAMTDYAAMNRRGFLKLLLPAAGAAAIAPDLLFEIWTPKRTIFLPPPGGWSLRSTGQVWKIDELGGYFYSRQLSQVLRQTIQPIIRFRQFTNSPTGFVVPDSWDVFGDTHAALATERR